MLLRVFLGLCSLDFLEEIRLELSFIRLDAIAEKGAADSIQLCKVDE